MPLATPPIIPTPINRWVNSQAQHLFTVRRPEINRLFEYRFPRNQHEHSIGGEWFNMWQSQTWNGQQAAFCFYATLLGVLFTWVSLSPRVRLEERGEGGPTFCATGPDCVGHSRSRLGCRGQYISLNGAHIQQPRRPWLELPLLVASGPHVPSFRVVIMPTSSSLHCGRCNMEMARPGKSSFGPPSSVGRSDWPIANTDMRLCHSHLADP